MGLVACGIVREIVEMFSASGGGRMFRSLAFVHCNDQQKHREECQSDCCPEHGFYVTCKPMRGSSALWNNILYHGEQSDKAG